MEGLSRVTVGWEGIVSFSRMLTVSSPGDWSTAPPVGRLRYTSNVRVEPS